jgi:hypothetical protein
MASAETDCKHLLFEAVNTKSISKFQFVKNTFMSSIYWIVSMIEMKMGDHYWGWP